MGVVCHADRGAVFPLYAKHHVVIICLLRSLVNFMVIGTATLIADMKVLKGNTDYTTAVGRILDKSIIAQFIKINVKTFNGYPSLRVELYGCTDGMRSFKYQPN